MRGGTAASDRSDGRSELFVQPGPITLFRDGACRSLTVPPNLLRAKYEAVDPQHSVIVRGHYFVKVEPMTAPEEGSKATL